MPLTEHVQLLQKIVATPSFSREEGESATIIENFLSQRNIKTRRKFNNVWAYNQYFNPSLPTLLLNSHHDTVKPADKWTKNPFEPVIEDGKLFGLGSNDAGGALVALLFTFLHFYEQKDLGYNLIFAATAEEEISGENGIGAILPELRPIALGIVGEPTTMKMAIAEKGLMVLDCEAEGKSGHAARDEGENAIYKALSAIEWFKNYRFSEKSELLGEVKMSVTQIQAGSQHNVVPDSCKFVVDIRTNEKYTNQQLFDFIKSQIDCKIKARSLRLNSSRISSDHPIIKKGISIGLTYFGSPTLSDQALLNFPTLKIGPGDSARSHTADEFIYLQEIEEGIETYTRLLTDLDL
jgi:acetylornithine deacetylase